MYRLFVAVGILSLCACGGGETPSVATEKKQVICTTGMIGDLARHVAGDRAEVIALMGPGIDREKNQKGMGSPCAAVCSAYRRRRR